MFPFRYLLSILIIILTSLPLFGNIINNNPEDKSVKVDIAAGNYYLKSANRQKAYIQIELTASELETTSARQPINMALVIDRSVLDMSENPDIIIESILDVINQLQKIDTLSILTFGNTVNTVFPAARVTDYQQLKDIVRNITSDDGSVLFAAVSKAAYEVQKFNKPDVISRIIIVSRNAISIGPDDPEIMGELGSSLLKDNITITAIGIGNRFSDQCLSALTLNSEGHFYYIENNSQLPKVLSKEISNALTVTARDINAAVTISENVRSVRSLKKYEVRKDNCTNFFVKELYANQPYSILIEADVIPGQSTKVVELATIEISYKNILTNIIEHKTRTLKAIYTSNDSIINNNINAKVMSSVSAALILDRYKTITELREKGNIHRAVTMAQETNSLLEKYCIEYQNKRMDNIAKSLSEMPEIIRNDNSYYNGGRKQLLSIIYSDY